MTKKNLAKKFVSNLKKKASKRSIGKIIGLDRKKEIEEEFNKAFK